MHLFVSVPPYHSISKVIQQVKGKTSLKFLSDNRTLMRQFWGRHLWARGYFSATSGNVTDDVIAQYIVNIGDAERALDNDFTLS